MTNIATAATDAVVPFARGAAAREWREGWPVILAGVFGYMLVSIGMMSMGTFMAPIQAEYGWSRGVISAGFSIYAIVGIPLAPVVGILVDRFGARLLSVTGSLLVGLTFALFGTITSSLLYWYAIWLAFATANQLIMPTVWSGATARVFNASRGLAIAVTMAGTALIAIVGPITANILIEHHGFRLAFVIMGACAGGITALISWMAMPGRVTPQGPAAGAAAAELPGLTVSQGLRSRIFLKLGGMLFVTQAVLFALAVHMVPLLSATGLSRETAVWIGGSLGIAMAVGKISSGVAMDRLPGRLVTAACITFQIVAVAMLMVPNPSTIWAIAAVQLFGVAYGGLSPIFPYLASRFFGLRSFGQLFGWLTCLYALAFATGPALAGAIYDMTHGYRAFLMGVLPALTLVLLATASLGRYPDFSSPAAE
jgi:MFS family permease